MRVPLIVLNRTVHQNVQRAIAAFYLYIPATFLYYLNMRKDAENFIISADYDLGTAEHMLKKGRYLMVKTEREIKEIIEKFQAEIEKLGVKPLRMRLFGSYAGGTPREDSDIDVIVVSDDFKAMNLRERLELLGIAAGRVFEPIEALGYTQEELESRKNESFLETILKSA